MDAQIEAYRKRVFGFLLNYIKVRAEAEDLTQDVMVKVWMNKDKFSQIRDLDAYILTIARNVVIDHFKRMYKSREYKESVWRSMRKEENNVLGYVLRKDLLEQVELVICELPPRQQAVYRMNRLEGLSLKEIGIKLNISRFTVKNHLAQAKKHVLSKVKPEYFLCFGLFFGL